MPLDIPFCADFASLPGKFHTLLAPTPVRAPTLIKVNHRLARDLGLDPVALESPEGVAILAGNAVPEGAKPLAQVYAGHQFGGWSPRLGDGRAVLLGELRDRSGQLRDVQLKGAGQTPYSRMGDGRAWLGPVLREYILSEAMFALGVPTTRALAAVATGEQVFRERPLPGAVLARVAASHIRVGTFQYFAAQRDEDALATLCEYTIKRHFPQAGDALGLLRAAVAAQASLIVKWMGLGFIHGVMNTDNMTLSGETIDYGPCAFMEAYAPGTVYSSIDQYGRYSYGNQPQIAVWNLAQLATALLPLIDSDEERAIEVATEAVQGFADAYSDAWTAEFGRKLGIATPGPEDAELAQSLLKLMVEGGTDFTLTFRGLASGESRKLFADPAGFDAWSQKWRRRLDDGSTERMRQANPAFIPRNHRVEEAIQAGVSGDFGPFERLLAVLSNPFDDQPDALDLAAPAASDEAVLQTFCGT